MIPSIRLTVWLAGALVVLAVVSPLHAAGTGETLGYHEIQVDDQGYIVPWYSDNLGVAYSHDIGWLVWNWWKNLETCSNGLKYYTQHQVWRPEHDSRGLGDTAVLAAEQALRLAEEAHALASSLSETVEKVRAGAASPIEETRAAVRFHGVAAEVERARRDVALARADLALAVGDGAVRTQPLEGRLSEDTTLPDPAPASARLAASPDLLRLEQEVLVRQSVLAAEQTQSSRDFSWRVAANHSTHDDEAWLTGGLTIPLRAPRNAGHGVR